MNKQKNINIDEDWRTGVFTREDLTSYRAEMTKRVDSVASSIKSMKQKHSEYAELFDNLVQELMQSLDSVLDESVEKLTDATKLKEASYGGAYDIPDDAYFTKEELIEFGEDVVENLNEIGSGDIKLESIYIDNNILEIAVDYEGSEITVEQSIDMRRIQKPKDLSKYRVKVISKIKPQLEELGYNFGPNLNVAPLTEDFDHELRDDLVKRWFDKDTADWLVKSDPAYAEWLAYGEAVTTQSLMAAEKYAKEHLAKNTMKEAWQQLKTKEVTDSDGFITEYSLWHNNDDDTYVCIFGDSEMYTPDDSYPDAEFDTEQEAYEWFNSYEGFRED